MNNLEKQKQEEIFAKAAKRKGIEYLLKRLDEIRFELNDFHVSWDRTQWLILERNCIIKELIDRGFEPKWLKCFLK